MAVVKANYVKRGKGAVSRAKATIRYITHRPGQDGERTARALFGWDGQLSKEQAYRMIDAAPRGTIFYRIVVSPDPRAEDRYHDLTLAELTTDTLLALEERLGRQVQFVAAVHDDHSPNRHVHTLVLVHRRLTRADFRALRTGATRNARLQRRLADLARARSRARLRLRTRSTRHPASIPGTPRRLRRFRLLRFPSSYTCARCGYHQVLSGRPSVPARC